MSETKQTIPRVRPWLPGKEAHSRIMAAVAALIVEQGVAALNVSAVMRRAGVSRTTFYRHFSDVYMVVAGILTGLRRELQERSGSWLMDPDSVGGLGVIYPNILGYAHAYAEHGPLMAALSDAAGVDDRVHSIWWDELLETYIDLTTAAIVRDQAVGAIRADLDATAAARALILMGERLSYDLLGRHRRGTPEDCARIMTSIWATTLFGVVPADADPA
jgi:AcrR family transcriptional regulator